MKKSLMLFGILIVILLIGYLSIPNLYKAQRTMSAPESKKRLYEYREPELSEIVENELKKLTIGRILFNVPQEMKVGTKERVEFRIAKNFTENLSTGLRGHGIPQIEEIKVNTLMGVRLNGDNFDIKALSHEEQIVTGDGFTQWDWDVTPLKSGIQRLLLSVTIRIKIPNYGEERKDYPVFERPIKVKVNPIYSLKNLIKSYWQWIVSTIIGSGIIGWIIKRILKKRRKGKRKKVI
jgi:hypothetical protein